MEDAVESLHVNSYYKLDVAEKTIVMALDLKEASAQKDSNFWLRGNFSNNEAYELISSEIVL